MSGGPFVCPTCLARLGAVEPETRLRLARHQRTRGCRADSLARELVARELAPFEAAHRLPPEVPAELHETRYPLGLAPWGQSGWVDEVESEYGQLWAPLWARVVFEAMVFGERYWSAYSWRASDALSAAGRDPELAAALEAVYWLDRARTLDARGSWRNVYTGDLVRGAAELLDAALVRLGDPPSTPDDPWWPA